MATFDFKVNPVTGNPEAQFTAELVSITENPLGETPINNKEWHGAQVKFENARGDMKTVNAIVFGGNVELAEEQGGFKVGEPYLCKAIKTQDRSGILITVSHLQNGLGATEDDFGYEEVMAEAPKASRNTSTKAQRSVKNPAGHM